jgi:hypothetical protein
VDGGTSAGGQPSSDGAVVAPMTVSASRTSAAAAIRRWGRRWRPAEERPDDRTDVRCGETMGISVVLRDAQVIRSPYDPI